MSVSIYKIFHIAGIMMIFLSIGGLLAHSINQSVSVNKWRKQMALTHGIGLLLVLVSGFGMIARLDITWLWPGWIFIKILIWIIMGGLVKLALQSDLSKKLWLLVILLGASAAFLALFKPI